MSKQLDALVKRGTICSYEFYSEVFERMYMVHLPAGKQWDSEPTCHTRGFDTVAEALKDIRGDVADYPDDPLLRF